MQPINYSDIEEYKGAAISLESDFIWQHLIRSRNDAKIVINQQLRYEFHYSFGVG